MSAILAEQKTGCGKPECGTTGCGSKNTAKREIWEIRTEERPYAFLQDKTNDDTNRYGQKIDLIQFTNGTLPVGRSMNINDNPAVGTNPNRNKQHGFFFTADNCIGCHACEAACSEKNNNPPHLAFRSVGYVEGGSFPDYKRMNISMACNHCDDPVCLKGCPTRAYTKHVEYGAVLQDPETCFGCGYCTWVCPYNAPQLDPIKGQVSKCNMCVDRLEVGLKPACVSACVGNALDFGVIENIPENREQARVEIPGFPSPEITRPNIRFQQMKQMPDEMKRTDSMPLKYHKNENGRYRPMIDQKKGKVKHWNLARLSSRENPLVLFTLSAQAAAGAFALPFIGAQLGIKEFISFSQSALYAPLGIFAFMLVAFGLFMSTMHLGKPMRFYRGFNNLRHSPVCREGLGIAIFMATMSMHIAFSLPVNSVFQNLFSSITGASISNLITTQTASQYAAMFAWIAIPASLAGLYYMNRCYRIKARPFWDHWQVASAFAGSTLSLGSLVSGAVMIPTLMFTNNDYHTTLLVCAALLTIGMSLEAIGHVVHARTMHNAEHEGGASYYVQSTTFGKTFLFRNILLGLNVVLAAGLLMYMLTTMDFGLYTLTGWALVGTALLVTSVIGRALFYVLVIPTTMPGAFFWKNKGFEEHARDIGLAHMPQVGVVPLHH